MMIFRFLMYQDFDISGHRYRDRDTGDTFRRRKEITHSRGSGGVGRTPAAFHKCHSSIGACRKRLRTFPGQSEEASGDYQKEIPFCTQIPKSIHIRYISRSQFSGYTLKSFRNHHGGFTNRDQQDPVTVRNDL